MSGKLDYNYEFGVPISHSFLVYLHNRNAICRCFWQIPVERRNASTFDIIILLDKERLEVKWRNDQKPILSPLFLLLLVVFDDWISTCSCVSDIRQVPDHQEVYLSSTGFSSIVFDITERISEPSTDEGALKYHLEDIVESPEEVRVLSSNSVHISKLPCVSLLALQLAAQ